MDDHVLLFGDDGSPGADAAWGWIVGQRWPGWTVRVVTAEPPPAGSSTPTCEVQARSGLPEHERRAPSDASIHAIEHLRAIVDPGPALTQGVIASLVVIGAKGINVTDRGRPGTTTDYLIRHAGSPLVVAKHAGPVRRVLVAVDGSRHARAAAHALVGMPWIDEIEAVKVLGVHEELRNVERGIEEGLGLLLDAGVPASRTTADGAVADEILAEAERQRADLVTLGTRGFNPLHRLVVGSTARTLARSSPCSVLLATGTGSNP